MQEEPITTRAGLVSTGAARRKSPSLLKRAALLGGIVVVAIALVAGAILAYSYGTRGTETAAAHGTPDGNLRDIASHAGFPVLVPAWLPQGVTLTSALGGSAGHSYDITLQYGPHPPIATLPLTYDVMETSDASLNFGYQFVDPAGVTHPVQTTDHSVMIGGVPGTLREYTCVWQGKVVLHALTVSWRRAGALYLVAAQDVIPEAYAANAPAVLRVDTTPQKASADTLLHIAGSFQPLPR